MSIRTRKIDAMLACEDEQGSWAVPLAVLCILGWLIAAGCIYALYEQKQAYEEALAESIAEQSRKYIDGVSIGILTTDAKLRTTLMCRTVDYIRGNCYRIGE